MISSVRAAALTQAAALAVLFMLGLAERNGRSWIAFVAIGIVYVAAGQSIRLARHWMWRLEWSLGFGWCAVAAVFLGADRGETNAAGLVIPVMVFPYGAGIGLATWLLVEAALLVSRLRRPRRGHCAACNYNLTGLAPDTRCPECGASSPGGGNRL